MNKEVKKYVFYTYATFWILLVLAGIVMMKYKQPWLPKAGVIIFSQVPTVVLLIRFKKLCPEITRKAFYRKLFKNKINYKTFSAVTLIMMLLFFMAVAIVKFVYGGSFTNLLNLSLKSMAISFIYNFLCGPIGEESGWRGFFHPIMEKRYGIIKGSLLIGIIWAMWHFPLWLISGYKGLNLLLYSISFIICVTAFAVIIGICYKHNNNLFVTMWMHLIFNFSLGLYKGNLLHIFTIFTMLYVVAAMGFVLWEKKQHRISQNSVLVTDLWPR
ncbi:CPBP family intramembrane metalloprotease [Clostridium estertheticum]|nr:CPBP family intramembrane metalloprotease [Clostridium estertheticum]